MINEKVLLKDIAYAEIKTMIMNKEVEHMSENKLVEELKMSRTPIREALHRLQHEGFIKVISNQGIVVKEISIDRLHDLINMRVAIETFSLKQAKELINKDHFADIEKIIQSQKKACQEEDVYQFKEKDAEFHNYLLSITGNHYFLKMFSEAHELQFIARSRMLSKEGMEKLIVEHEDITRKLQNKDIESALSLLKDHLNDGKKGNLLYRG